MPFTVRTPLVPPRDAWFTLAELVAYHEHGRSA
jgi:hypothetical protein